MNDPLTQNIEDAAVLVATFSKTHEWPSFGTPEFFEFAQKLDVLSTAITAKYPSFNRNIQWSAPTPAPKGKERGTHESSH
jgi:hypothetical protein